MNTQTTMRKIINIIYGGAAILVMLSTVAILAIGWLWVAFSLIIVNIWPASGDSGFILLLGTVSFLSDYVAMMLGYAAIPMGLITIATWALNRIKQRPNWIKWTILLFLPTLFCVIFNVVLWVTLPWYLVLIPSTLCVIVAVGLFLDVRCAPRPSNHVPC